MQELPARGPPFFCLLIYAPFTEWQFQGENNFQRPHSNLMKREFLVAVLLPKMQQLHGNNKILTQLGLSRFN